MGNDRKIRELIKKIIFKDFENINKRMKIYGMTPNEIYSLAHPLGKFEISNNNVREIDNELNTFKDNFIPIKDFELIWAEGLKRKIEEGKVKEVVLYPLPKLKEIVIMETNLYVDSVLAVLKLNEEERRMKK